MTGSFVWQNAAVSFVLVTVMGIAIGIAVALVIYAMYRWLPTTPSIDVALSFASPYLMYMAAEAFEFSGVMAVVSGGLFLSYHNHKLLSHTSRLQGLGMWATVTFILNGLVFMMIGLELPSVMNALGDYSKGEAIGYALAITAVIIITRIGVALGTSLFTRFMSNFIFVNDKNPGWRGPLVLGWAGMRGVVSLASALSVPLLLKSGEAFPHRNLILFITFVVILVTLIIQGLTLPLVIRWVNLKELDGLKPKDEQEAEIQLHLSQTALQHIDNKYGPQAASIELVKTLKNQLQSEVQVNTHYLESDECDPVEKESIDQYHRIYVELIHVRRSALFVLRDKEGYDDEVIRKLEGQLDLEEEKWMRENE